MSTAAPLRDELRRAGAALRQRLGLPADLHGDLVPGFRGLFDELVFGALWSRPGPDLRERMIAVVASLAALERREILTPYAKAATAAGLPARGVREVVLQAGLYAGFVSAETNLAAVNAVLGPPSDESGDDGAGLPPDADLLEPGLSLMAALHGDRARGGYASGAGAPAVLYDLAIRYGYGELWHRPGLSRRERLIVAVSVFATLEHESQLLKFATSAMSGEMAPEEVRGILMQIAPYCGFPRILNALAALDRQGA